MNYTLNIMIIHTTVAFQDFNQLFYNARSLYGFQGGHQNIVLVIKIGTLK